MNTLVFLPFVKQLAWLVSRIVPEKQEAPSVPHLTHLDIRFLDTPAISIVQSHKQILVMANSNQEMLEKLALMLEGPANAKLEKEIFDGEQTLDNVQKEIMLFLGDLLSGQVSHDVMEKARGQMRMADEYESVSDCAVGVLKGQLKLRTNNLELAPEDIEEFKDINRRVLDYLKLVSTAVSNEDQKAAIQLLSVKSEITGFIKEYRHLHLNRVSAGKVSALSSLVCMDMLNCYRRINDHILNIAEVAAGEK